MVEDSRSALNCNQVNSGIFRRVKIYLFNVLTLSNRLQVGHLADSDLQTWRSRLEAFVGRDLTGSLWKKDQLNKN